MSAPPKITRRMFLVLRVMGDGVPVSLATEAVASTAIEHPEWDMDERATLIEWEREYR